MTENEAQLLIRLNPLSIMNWHFFNDDVEIAEFPTVLTPKKNDVAHVPRGN